MCFLGMRMWSEITVLLRWRFVLESYLNLGFWSFGLWVLVDLFGLYYSFWVQFWESRITLKFWFGGHSRKHASSHSTGSGGTRTRS